MSVDNNNNNTAGNDTCSTVTMVTTSEEIGVLWRLWESFDDPRMLLVKNLG